MIAANGLRSSCDASPDESPLSSWPASMRASISFMVIASAEISSKAIGTGTRSPKSELLMSATRARIASTDRSDRATNR